MEGGSPSVPGFAKTKGQDPELRDAFAQRKGTSMDDVSVSSKGSSPRNPVLAPSLHPRRPPPPQRYSPPTHRSATADNVLYEKAVAAQHIAELRKARKAGDLNDAEFRAALAAQPEPAASSGKGRRHHHHKGHHRSHSADDSRSGNHQSRNFSLLPPPPPPPPLRLRDPAAATLRAAPRVPTTGPAVGPHATAPKAYNFRIDRPENEPDVDIFVPSRDGPIPKMGAARPGAGQAWGDGYEADHGGVGGSGGGVGWGGRRGRQEPPIEDPHLEARQRALEKKREADVVRELATVHLFHACAACSPLSVNLKPWLE